MIRLPNKPSWSPVLRGPLYCPAGDCSTILSQMNALWASAATPTAKATTAELRLQGFSPK
jgi:hypothetical protein